VIGCSVVRFRVSPQISISVPNSTTCLECEKRLAPDRHAHHPVARDDRLAADIVSDGFRIDPANFSLIAGGAQSFCDRNVLFHEAEVKDDACDALDHFNHLYPTCVGDARRLLDGNGK
jgi:hypothetical protein